MPSSSPPAPSASVRHATPEDGPALRRLQRHLDEQAPALLDAALTGIIGECLVAVDTGDTSRPVGYLLATEGDGGVPTVGSAVDSSHPADKAEASTVHLAELVVAPEARRNGHASALLATLLARHPAATVTLTVAPDNAPARALYERFGFEVERTLPDFFDDGPGLLLARRPRPE